MSNNVIGGRNYGIDLLRLVCMLFIVELHVFWHGGILSSVDDINYGISWLIETFIYCAIDCYLIISGYVSYSTIEKDYNFSRIISIWLQVFTYSFGITLIEFILKFPNIGKLTLLKAALPVTSGQYWYFSVYFGLVILTPWLSRLIHRLNEKELNQFVSVIVVVFVCYSTTAIVIGDPFGISRGYSLIWSIFMYVLGSWVKKCSIAYKVNNKKLIRLSISSGMITWVIHMLVPESMGGMLLTSYTSPTIVFMAFSWVVLFSKFKVRDKSKKWIGFWASAVFGVYLIHDHDIIRHLLIENAFIWIADSPFWLLPIQVTGVSVFIFVICIVIEKLREIIFAVAKIDLVIQKSASNIYRHVKRFWESIISRVIKFIQNSDKYWK